MNRVNLQFSDQRIVSTGLRQVLLKDHFAKTNDNKCGNYTSNLLDIKTTVFSHVCIAIKRRNTGFIKCAGMKVVTYYY